MTTKANPSVMSNVNWTFETLAFADAQVSLQVGDTVTLRNRTVLNDNGGGEFSVVAAGTGTDDGGAFHNLSASGLQLEQVHNRYIQAERWGVRDGVESSAAWQAAMHFAADLAPNARRDTEPAVTFACSTTVLTKNTLHVTKSDGKVLSYLTILHPGKIQLDSVAWDASDGDLSTHTDDAPIPILNTRLSRAETHWGEVDCMHRCAGVRYRNSERNFSHYMDLHSFRRYGELVLDNANNGLRLIDHNVKQWLLSDVDDYPLTPGGTVITGGANNPLVFDGDCLVVCQKDFIVTGGTWGWSRSATLTLDVTGRRSNTAGQDIYYDGLVESGDAFYHADNRVISNGTGDAIFQNLHVMQGAGANPTSPRADNIDKGGPVSIENWNTSNACYFYNCDIDASTVQLYGDGIIFDEASYISGGTNTQSDRVIVMDPRVRVYRHPTGTDFGSLRLGGLENTSIGFYDGDGGALTGDYSDWNYANRADSGTYNGVVTFINFFDASGGSMPNATATAGDFWVVDTAGTIGGEVFAEGDYIYALINNPGSAWNASNWHHSEYGDVMATSNGYAAEVAKPRYLMYARDANTTIEKFLRPGGTFKRTYNVGGLEISVNHNAVNGITNFDHIIGCDELIIDNEHTPSSASDTGTKGRIVWDNNYIYICIATDTWTRVAISTW